MLNITRTEFTSVMTGFSSFITEWYCETVNSLLSDAIVYWSPATCTAANNVFDPFNILNILLIMACHWIFIIMKILTNNGVAPVEVTNIEIYRLTFISKRHIFVLHVTNVITRSVEVTHHEVGARLCTVLPLTQLAIWQSDWMRDRIRSTNLHIVVKCQINTAFHPNGIIWWFHLWTV